MRLAADVFVLEDGLALDVEGTEADDHAVHRSHAARLVAPLEGAMGEMDVHAPGQQPAPQHADLLALRDAVGGNESKARLVSFRTSGIACRLDVPRRHEVEQPGAVDTLEHHCHIGALALVQELGADERRIAHDIVRPLGGKHLVPVQPRALPWRMCGVLLSGMRAK